MCCECSKWPAPELVWVVLQDFGESEDIDGAFEHYCSEVADTAAWGGQTELNALCQSLKQHIKVFAVGLPPIDMGSNFIGETLVAPALHA